jgi:hypothetical protein
MTRSARSGKSPSRSRRRGAVGVGASDTPPPAPLANSVTESDTSPAVLRFYEFAAQHRAASPRKSDREVLEAASTDQTFEQACREMRAGKEHLLDEVQTLAKCINARAATHAGAVKKPQRRFRGLGK